MYLTILILPLLGSLIPMLMGRSLGINGSRLLTTGSILLTSVLSLIAFYEVVLSGSTVSLYLGEWISAGTLQIEWSFLFDSLTVSMLLPVLLVSGMVHIYSYNYMSSDPHIQRFFSYLSMFTFFMLILVSGDNYLILFLGWEGIGVSSYLLISFWYTRLQAVKSAIEAMVVNRVGDTFLSLSFFFTFWALGSLDYETVFSLVPFIDETVLSIIGLLFLFAAMGKSAQLGLHTWLPLAMEGPTPVSALIHAATLVTAGVYLLVRSSPLLEYAPTALIVITWVGALTSLFAATTGLVQNDIKRVIAYSTCSQMGYLFMAVGISSYDVSLFHLVNHAFFKAVLFLSAGGVLHSMSDQQDMRRLGALIQFLPFTYLIILIGSLSLMALPFFTGFYSKDLILESGYAAYSLSGHLVFWLGSLTAFITAFYSWRLISLTFLTTPNANKSSYENTHEQPLIIVIPLVLLAILSIGFGYIAKDIFIGLGSDVFQTAINIAPNHLNIIEAEFSLPQILKLLPAIVTLIGAISSIMIYHYFNLSQLSIVTSIIGQSIYTFLIQKWQFDVLINQLFTRKALWVGFISSHIIDKGVIEIIGPRGLSESLQESSNRLTLIDTGKITDYALFFMIGLITILTFEFSESIIFNTSYYDISYILINSLLLIFLLQNSLFLWIISSCESILIFLLKSCRSGLTMSPYLL